MLNSIQTDVEDSMADTIGETLKIHNIGQKIRRLRLRKSMGLVELGKHTSLSPAMLSKLENGRVVPTLSTLTRIALTFAVGLDYFFSAKDHRNVSVVRKHERQEFHNKESEKDSGFSFQCLDYKAVERKSSAFLANFKQIPPESVAHHEHTGSEFIYTLTGKLGLIIEDEEIQLEEGDSVYFDPSFSHGYRQIGQEPCRALVFTVP